MVLVRTRPLVRQRPTAWPSASLMRDMEAFFRDVAGDRPGAREQRAFPAVNVTQDPERFYLRAELPGMIASELDLSVDQNKVTLRGVRDIPAEGDEVSVHRRERVAGSFARTVTLPADIDAEGVQADYRNGVLTVTVPEGLRRPSPVRSPSRAAERSATWQPTPRSK